MQIITLSDVHVDMLHCNGEKIIIIVKQEYLSGQSFCNDCALLHNSYIIAVIQ